MLFVVPQRTERGGLDPQNHHPASVQQIMHHSAGADPGGCLGGQEPPPPPPFWRTPTHERIAI